MKKKKEITAKKQLTRNLTGVLLLLLIIGNLLFVLLSFFSAYEYLEDRSDNMIEAIQKGSQDNLQQILDATVSSDDEDAVRVILTDGTTYYSDDAEEIFSELSRGRYLPFFSDLLSSEEGIYLYQSEKYNGGQIEVAVNSETILDITSSMVMLNIFLNVVTIVVGATLIYYVVGKWSQKLSRLANEIHLVETEDLPQVTEINEPMEMQAVTQSFNQLLIKQKAAMERESQFVTDASHELRTPIAAIRGHVNLIKRRGQEHPEVVEKSLAFIDQESKRMEVMSNQLLTLGRSQKDEATETVNLSQLVKESIEKIQTISDHVISYQIAPDVTGTFVKNDLNQILQNLLENAVKYSPDKQPIEVTLKNVDGKIKLAVIDQGIGISDDQKTKIFERFYRVDDAHSSVIEGSGIGLSIVDALVKKYQGEITVTDNQPQGTIFTIIF
ncbi:sensor histidine kinase [Enterococcus alishanensis]|uniref:histidine kinase n=1 Tax=Enterococcus alishanensis TaxID=1303817 RepID=A0ABS6T8G0_9ENTE|nr:HAMP domain-containing sensor histidine kinase [Enterococcus alishanensis]MBV7389053.1 HAMP domain-containing histidine kinase [Enterococcus alishanensis]